MPRILVLLSTALLAAAPMVGARASSPTPVCRLPTVVEAMAQELRLNPHYTRLDPALIGEAPTADPATVRCQLCLRIVLYHTARFGDAPVARCEGRAFTVRALPNGFVVAPAAP